MDCPNQRSKGPRFIAYGPFKTEIAYLIIVPIVVLFPLPIEYGVTTEHKVVSYGPSFPSITVALDGSQCPEQPWLVQLLH